MIDLDITLPIQIVNIFFLIVVLNAVLYKPIRGILEKRGKYFADLEQDVANFEKNAQARLAEFDKKMNDARRKAKGEIESVRSAAQAAGQETVDKIRKKAEEAKAEQLAQIESEFSNAQKILSKQVNNFANEIAGKVMGRAV
jgi:F-type H+-transporting ATPase subunit b